MYSAFGPSGLTYVYEYFLVGGGAGEGRAFSLY